ncbi:MAG: aa3-type cytochrome c oxidase subunit IV [Aliishimia sp.]
MADHKHGEMDIKTQEAVFEGFMAWTKWSVIAIIGLVILMAIFIT